MGPVLTRNQIGTVGKKTRKTQAGGGLCLICANSEDCTFTGNSGRPVSSCGEFTAVNNRFMGVDEARLMNVVSGILKKPARSSVDENRVQGLCSHCRNFKGCTFPRMEGGVWNCDEYQE